MPPRKKHQVHPIDPRDLVCDTCPNRCPYGASPAATEEMARVRGWRVFDGPSLTDKPLKVACCPECFRTGTPARPTGVPVLEGQLDLPGLITPIPVQRSKTNKRQMS
jgi:hypothetical protein